MRKHVVLASIIYATLLLFPLPIAKVNLKASPGTIRVPTDFLTIQEAINAATTGDTIFVYNGTYPEHVIVNKTVTLVGENRETTIIDGTGTDTVVNITSNNAAVNNFTIKNGYYLVYIYYSDGNTISNNTITDGSSVGGILLDHSNNNIVSNNTVTKCIEYGIWLHYSGANTINDTTTAENWIGAMLYHSDSNSLNGNNIANNTYGIWLSYSNNNKVYHNNFNNTEQVRSSSSVNIWDDGYPSGGNFWSDYTGQDSDGDGIGDTPYVIDASNQDNYPLWPYITGDINYDGTVNASDLSAFSNAYGATPDSPNWNARADINDDLIVDVNDLFTIGKNFGKTSP